jgi:Fe2+ or Zn2+ uptake regulation protein/O6-methylguanine-DNA--protein-cysteine methyltransferase
MADATDSAELLRARGLRVTPQRRAILGAFSGGRAEHLSADEIHARAASVVPDIGRGTVYATLAELTELGLLVARGSPEPVRYETNLTPHQHFRCRLCLRVFDVDIAAPATGELAAQGFTVELMTVTAEGVCAECAAYDHGLRAAAKAARGRATPELPDGLTAATVDTPLGTLTLGATAAGLVRVVFDSHADVPALQETIRSRRGGRAARKHIAAAQAAVATYFAGGSPGECAIDWAHLDDPRTLRATMGIRRGQTASYEALDTPATAEERGRALGANPLAIIVPCHRVTRGVEVPTEYVGGPEERRALRELERE